MMVDFAAGEILSKFAIYLDVKVFKSIQNGFVQKSITDSLTPLLITLLSPFIYVCFDPLSVITFPECLRELDLG